MALEDDVIRGYQEFKGHLIAEGLAVLTLVCVQVDLSRCRTY